MKQVLSFIISMFLCQLSYGQSIDGVWKGSTEHSLWVLNPTGIMLEMNVSGDTLITGVIHNFYSKGRFEHVKISGAINWKDSIVEISEEGEISHNINTRIFETCLGNMRLNLSKRGDKFFLSGKWRDNNRKLFHCPTLNMHFEKSFDNPPQSNQGDAIHARSTEIQQVVELDKDEADSIRCSLFDNGEIDHDTASVYFNDKLVLKNVALSQVPRFFNLIIDKKEPFSKITLVAENLGSIPPNTALLIIETKKNRFQLTLSSDFSTNASIEFFLKK